MFVLWRLRPYLATSFRTPPWRSPLVATFAADFLSGFLFDNVFLFSRLTAIRFYTGLRSLNFLEHVFVRHLKEGGRSCQNACGSDSNPAGLLFCPRARLDLKVLTAPSYQASSLIRAARKYLSSQAGTGRGASI